MANVALAMLWGFAVTFVFVRALPGMEFQAFLLLIAFNNFTQSSEFGLTNVIYARLRKYWLGRAADNGVDGGTSDFRYEEIGALFLFLGSLIIMGAAIVALAIAVGWIRTELPAIFLIFFLSSVLNMLLLLVKRSLAALDYNMVWEIIDCARRMAGLGILVSVLFGLDLMLSVSLQLLLNGGAVLAGMILVQRRSGMHVSHWFALRTGGGHIRRTYLRDIGASAALTMSEMAAYNGPYFMIAALSHDLSLMLLFDFVFKIIRSVAITIRATIEGALPRLTRFWFSGDKASFRAALKKALMVGIGVAVCADISLLIVGKRLFSILFDGRSQLSTWEMLLLCVLLLMLSVICVSVYLQGSLGRFWLMLRQSLPFLAGSLLSVPLALLMAGNSQPGEVGLDFMIAYTLAFFVAAMLHLRAIGQLVKG
ncbi:MAG: hypothetical protein E2598_03645 [Sphingobium sp.]|nr:hypothetical protein [Sphingobium sp.]